MQKVKGKIVEIFGSQKAFSKALGVTEATVTNKLKNKRNLTQAEMITWSELLQIPKADIVDYFF